MYEKYLTEEHATKMHGNLAKVIDLKLQYLRKKTTHAGECKRTMHKRTIISLLRKLLTIISLQISLLLFAIVW